MIPTKSYFLLASSETRIMINNHLSSILICKTVTKMDLLFCCRNPATFLHAYSCLPLAYAARQAAGAILQDVAGSGVLFSLLMCKHKVPFPSFLLY